MYTLRDYQKNAVQAVIRFFKKHREPAVVVLPTGAGKSLVIAEIARLAQGRVLVLAHVKELIEQNFEKYSSYGGEAGLFSASLGKKDTTQKCIFGSIQSIARADETFFNDFSIVIVDECHRVAEDQDSQYREVLNKLTIMNPKICILGLTATPYRLGLGWIYEEGPKGEVRTEMERYFKKCVFELPLSYMIKNRYLTAPVKIDIPVTCYDFSELKEQGGRFSQSEIEEILKNQNRLTPLIIENVVDITEKFQRQGVMIFSGSTQHAKEILSYLPQGQARIVLGDTDLSQREQIISDFKARHFKYLVNVSVLTTGFDAPHVDVIAILRPTESNGLYQQIVGRGLRLSEGKSDCYILDYTGMGHDLYKPEIGDTKPAADTVPVQIECPQCSFTNDFWGYIDEFGEVIEHFGRKCKGSIWSTKLEAYDRCGFRFRFKICPSCSEQNDLTARACSKCHAILIDADAKLKQARLSKGAHIMIPDSVVLEEQQDRNGNEYLEIRFYDLDSNYLSEVYFFNNVTAIKKFNVNFLRAHLKRPELKLILQTPQEVIQAQHLLRMPKYLIARKQDKYWRITEKIFIEELN